MRERVGRRERDGRSPTSTGVELTARAERALNFEYQREKLIDANFTQLMEWKKEFEAKNGRPPTKADIALADPEMMKIAMRLGEI